MTSKYSAQINGKVLDWKFKAQHTFEDGTRSYTFWVGEHLVGTIFPMSRGHWSAVSYKPFEVGSVEGFATRYRAAEFLLKINRETLRKIHK